jgi:hypothetical protein
MLANGRNLSTAHRYILGSDFNSHEPDFRCSIYPRVVVNPYVIYIFYNSCVRRMWALLNSSCCFESVSPVNYSLIHTVRCLFLLLQNSPQKTETLLREPGYTIKKLTVSPSELVFVRVLSLGCSASVACNEDP